MILHNRLQIRLEIRWNNWIKTNKKQKHLIINKFIYFKGVEMFEMDYNDTLEVFSTIMLSNIEKACRNIGQQMAKSYFDEKKKGDKGKYYQKYIPIVDVNSFSDKFQITFKIRLFFVVVSDTADVVLQTLLVDKERIGLMSINQLEQFISDMIEENNTQLEIESYNL